MGYNTELADGYAIVHLDGQVDLSSSPEARKLILDALKHRHPVLVDLSQVDYIDSSGIANLVEGYQVARQHDLGFGLLGPSDPVMSVLRLARLDQVFDLYPTLAAWLERRDSSGP